jgi:hypothetical protein
MIPPPTFIENGTDPITFTPVGNDAGSPTAIQKDYRALLEIYIEVF